MKNIITPEKSVFRKLHCSHFKCETTTTQELTYKTAIYDSRQECWNVIFHKKCTVCQDRNPTIDVASLEITDSDKWNMWMKSQAIVV